MLAEHLQTYNIILASKSPRRQLLLKGLDISFEIKVREIDESYPANIQAPEVPEYLSKKKATAYTDIIKHNTLIITADTIVIQNGHVIEKPVDKTDAYNLIEKLSGNKHTVVSGVCITSHKKQVSFSAFTEVYFRDLTHEEITYYIEKYKPFDKAGAYGIQEWIGYCGIKKIEGSYFNVMGLPTQQLYSELLRF